MAPESVSHRIFTNKSDVWSYGVVLWEIWTYGRVPYGAVAALDVVQAVAGGKRLEKPADCPEDVFEIDFYFVLV